MCRACESGFPKKRTGDQHYPPDSEIVQCTESPNAMEVIFESSLRAMSTALCLCRDFLKLKNLSEDTKNHIVLRELFMNAIHHGNQMEVERKVIARLEWIPSGEVTIQVEDEGLGFDHRALNLRPPANPARMNHRGLILIHALCDEIEFNEKGNCVVVHIRTSEKGKEA